MVKVYYCIFYNNSESLLTVTKEYTIAIPDCFTPYLVNVLSMESCCICLETAFISKKFCIVVMVAAAAEYPVYEKGTF